MKSIKLEAGNYIDDNFINDLQSEELFYIRIESLESQSVLILDYIKKASCRTSQVFVSIPGEDYKNHLLRDQFFQAGIKGFALRFTHQVEKWEGRHGIGQYSAGDRDIIDLYAQYKNETPTNKQLVVEFQVGEDLRVLGPTITGVYEKGVPWIVLNVEGKPTSERCFQLRDVFEYLKIRSCNRLNVYFPFWSSHYEEWGIKTQNTFSGLEYVHIDISNRCTHSCVFCGLYGPDALEEMKMNGGGKISESISNHMKMEINPDKCFDIISSLPWSVKQIQFGGFGDPLMHDHAVEFIAAARRRGFKVEVLSNMEYLDDEDIHLLHKLGGKYQFDLHFLANISGGTSEIYLKNRPKQSVKNFERVIHNLKLFSRLRTENDNAGIFFTLMCVVNKDNCLHLLDVARLADEIKAFRLWFKPMEIHGDVHRKYIPSDEIMPEMASSLAEALKFAETSNIEVLGKEYCDEIIRKHTKKSIYDLVRKDKEAAMVSKVKLDVANGGIPADYYSKNPCLVGYTYLRFEVSGSIAPCCIAKHPIGNAYEQDWRDVWHSGAYENFRRKMSKIHLDRFHLKDPEWTFCQQCSHFELNKEKNDLLRKN